MKKEEKRTALKVRSEMKDLLRHLKNTASVAVQMIDEADLHEDAARYTLHEVERLVETARSIDELCVELANFPGGLDRDMRRLGRYPTKINGRKRYVSVPQD
jgi:hypothetical protein